VLGDDQARDVLQQAAWTLQGPVAYQLLRDEAGTGGIRATDAVVVVTSDLKVLKLLGALAARLACSCGRPRQDREQYESRTDPGRDGAVVRRFYFFS
jgi:hypothetical protein